MGFASETGYTPDDFVTLMTEVMNNINTQFGLNYDYASFVGTGYYKYFYALIQKVQENEIKTSEIFLNLQQYFKITNENIQRPVVTPPGLITVLKNAGYEASVKEPLDADAGKAFICVNVDPMGAGYAAKKLAINTIIKDCTSAGVVTQGDQVSTIVLSNGQGFDFKYAVPNKIPVLLKLTLTVSENNRYPIGDSGVIALQLQSQILARYGLGLDFEPQRYWAQADSPWAATVLLQWSDDAGSNYHSTVFDANFNDLYTFAIGDISIVEA